MRLFDSSLINRLILSSLIDKPLQHNEIVDTLSKELDLTQEEREEKDGSTNTGVFYHKVAGQEQSLKNQGLIAHNDETKNWEILEKGKYKLRNDMEVVNNASIFQFFCKKRGLSPQRIKKEDAQNINYLCYDKNKKETIVVDINPIIDEHHNLIKQIQEKIVIVKKYNQSVRGIIIMKEEVNNANFQKDHLENIQNIEIVYYCLDLKIEDKQSEHDNEILPSSENAFSDYLINHLSAFKNVGESLHKFNDEETNCRTREYKVIGRRSIDVLCRDDKNNIVVIENKTNTGTEYHVVGQILYYLHHMRKKKEYSQDSIRGIICIPNKNVPEKTQTIEDARKEALKGREEDIIKLLFYSLIISFR